MMAVDMQGKVTEKLNRAVIVLGMHRSGTSAMAGALSCMGVDLGPQLMTAVKGENDKGYFEHVEIVEMHERLLSLLGFSWDDLRLLPDGWWQQDIVCALKEDLLEILHRDFTDSDLWAVKDPRMCRLMPFWYSVLDELAISPTFVLMFRHPEEVAMSLHRRDGMDLSKGYLLWMYHTLEAEEASRGKARTFVHYEDLLLDSHQVMKTVSGQLDIDWSVSEQTSAALDALITPSLHHCHTPEGNTPEVVEYVYDILLRAVANGEVSPEDQEKLNDIRNGLRMTSSVLTPTLGEMNGLIESERCLHREVKCLNELEQHLREVVAEKERQVHQLQLHCNEFEQVVQQRDAQVAERDAQVAERDAQIAERDAQVAALNQGIAELRCAITEYMESTSWKLTAPLRWSVQQGRRISHLLHIAPQLIEQSGGVGSAVSKLSKVVFSEGLAGVKYRIRNRVGTSVVIGGTTETVDRNDYAAWVSRYDTMTDEQRALIGKKVEEMQDSPLISLVMPTYNPNPVWLKEAIESVQNQIYPNWELCIADDASTNSEVKFLLENYAAKDERIKIVFRTTNGHISAASNSALELVTGDWIALLDHDDLLSEHALFWVASAIHQNAGAGIIYSDEDKVDESGHRTAPYFKTDWNPDLFLSHNHICHLGVYRTSLVSKVHGFREGYEGAQDYDLALRCMEHLRPEQIIHIPKVLYHWRIHKGSTALAGSEKNYALVAGKKALDDHFKRCDIKAKAELLNVGMYRVHYELPTLLPLITIIIPTYNGLALLQQCIESIVSMTTYSRYEIIIIDNNSDDPDTLQYLKDVASSENIQVMRDPRPFNYSQLNNSAVEKAQGEYVLLMNNDIEVITPDWLSEMVSIAIQKGVGCVGARLWYPDDTLQHGGVILGLGGVAGHSHKHLQREESGYFIRAKLIQSLSAVTAACLLVHKDIYQQVDGLNEKDLKVAFNDVDFCLRVRRAGYRNIWTPYAELYHHESATRGYEDSPEKKKRFSKEVQYMKEYWGEELLIDPNYSLNLTLDFEDFSLAWPPRTDEWKV